MRNTNEPVKQVLFESNWPMAEDNPRLQRATRARQSPTNARGRSPAPADLQLLRPDRSFAIVRVRLALPWSLPFPCLHGLARPRLTGPARSSCGAISRGLKDPRPDGCALHCIQYCSFMTLSILDTFLSMMRNCHFQLISYRNGRWSKRWSSGE